METVKLFDPATTALVLIDHQNGIVGRQLAPNSGTDVVRKGADLAAAFRAAGSPVVYVHVDVNNVLHLPTDRQMRDPNAPPPPASASELVPDSGFQPGDHVVLKRQWGAFHATDLDQHLRRRNVRTIVLCGIATNIGVESTARSAIEHGYAIVFASDAMTTFSADAHAFAVNVIFPIIGRVRTTAEIVTATTCS